MLPILFAWSLAAAQQTKQDHDVKGTQISSNVFALQVNIANIDHIDEGRPELVRNSLLVQSLDKLLVLQRDRPALTDIERKIVLKAIGALLKNWERLASPILPEKSKTDKQLLLLYKSDLEKTQSQPGSDPQK